MNTSDHVDVTSTPSHSAHSSVKEKAIEEFRMFWVIAIYLGMMLAAFAWYRRLVLSEAGISYLHYGAAVIEALVLAKVILIGQALGLGRRFEGAPLIFSVLFKALVFGLFIALFNKVEDAIVGLVHRESWDQISRSLFGAGRAEYLARTVIAIITLIPFFAFWETGRVLGGHKLFALFFHKRAT
jgi:uncharacterized membrane protein YczE